MQAIFNPNWKHAWCKHRNINTMTDFILFIIIIMIVRIVGFDLFIISKY